MSSGQKEGLLDSLLDAVKPSNVIYKFIQFIVFGLVTATPYVVKNMDLVMTKVEESGSTGFWVIWAFAKALLGAMWKGVAIGLSTVFDTIFIKRTTVISEKMVGTIIFTVVVIFFATLMFYQPIRLIFNIFDRKRGRVNSAVTIYFISLVFVVILASPIAWLAGGGDTITSGIQDESVDDGQASVNETAQNVTADLPPENVSIINSLNMLGGA